MSHQDELKQRSVHPGRSFDPRSQEIGDAAAVDGISHGYRVIVPEECVSDRAEGSDYASLFDINAKYGDVVTTAEVVKYFGVLAAKVGERRAAAATAR